MARKLQPYELPDWPRRMGLILSAAYVDISPTVFRDGVTAGKYPAPIMEGKRRLWDRKRLDEIIDQQSGITQESGGWDI